jgi:hypothetical protein
MPEDDNIKFLGEPTFVSTGDGTIFEYQFVQNSFTGQYGFAVGTTKLDKGEMADFLSHRGRLAWNPVKTEWFRRNYPRYWANFKDMNSLFLTPAGTFMSPRAISLAVAEKYAKPFLSSLIKMVTGTATVVESLVLPGKARAPAPPAPIGPMPDNVSLRFDGKGWVVSAGGLIRPFRFAGHIAAEIYADQVAEKYHLTVVER